MKNFSVAILTFAALAAITSCKKDEPEDPPYQGVEINGVRWAEFNVSRPGAFTASPEARGMLYQWNRRTAWLATGYSPESSPAGSTWDNTTPAGDAWTTANNPCPLGWRLPTKEEQATLLDGTMVTRVWESSKGGHTFTDKISGASIFLPAAGYRYHNNGGLEYEYSYTR